MENSCCTVKPRSEIAELQPVGTSAVFDLHDVLPVVGMSESFVKKIIGNNEMVTENMIHTILEQDMFSETFVPRSKILPYLLSKKYHTDETESSDNYIFNGLHKGNAIDLLNQIKDNSINCVVTSTPYWAMRIYDISYEQKWADGDVCSFGLEQTPEAFIRHSVEILYHLYKKITPTGSVWWNLMDSYNTRTQIRSNASETLAAMRGFDSRSWKDYKYKRYSSGHAYLKDGEQCLIPQQIAERASRIGYFIKSTISWCKTASLPEPQTSRVSRNTEYILHLTKTRTPVFHKEMYLSLPSYIGGRQPLESEKLSDFWYLPTSTGGNEHGAQFPLQLPGRCIALSSNEGDIVLDPFIGSGTTAVASVLLNRKYIGFDISEKYLSIAKEKVQDALLKNKFG